MTISLKEARRQFIAGVQTKEGTECPCCRRFAKINKMKITKSMTRALVWIASKSGTGERIHWVKVQEEGPDWLKRSNSHAKLIHWGLLERKENDDDSKKHSGIYRPTRHGIDFLKGKVKVRQDMPVYNNTPLVMGGIGKLVDVYDCMKKPFDYAEMVKEVSA